MHLSNSVLNVYKPLGWTPLEALNRLKIVRPDLANIPLTYAGRLDPLAEGVLIVLSGDAIEEKEKFLSYDKTYLASIVLGMSTDSFDSLGLVKKESSVSEHIHDDHVQHAVDTVKQLFEIQIPPYSSVPVQGKPLFVWAQEDKLNHITIPSRPLHLHSMDLLSRSALSSVELLEIILKKVDLVRGDFRQDQIKKLWKETLSQSSEQFTILDFRIQCGSGTYIRSLAQILGQQLGSGAFLLHLQRTAVGPYDSADSYSL